MNTKRVSITIVKILFKSVHLELSLLLIDSFFPHSCGCEFLSVGCHCGGSSWKCQPYPLCCRTAGYWPLSECAGDVTKWNCHWWVRNWILCRLAKLVTLVKSCSITMQCFFLSAGSDYSPISSTLTLTSSTTMVEVLIPIIDDSVVETDEQFTVVLSSSDPNVFISANYHTTVTIVNNDGKLYVFIVRI